MAGRGNRPAGVYPRVGGGNIEPPAQFPLTLGLSPRGRGKRRVRRGNVIPRGSIPAWAGETQRSGFRRCAPGVYPRVGGGNAITPTPGLLTGGLSPRGRGKRRGGEHFAHPERSIPAWAGETPLPGQPLLLGPVYPRVGGGNRSPIRLPRPASGLSPRGRGKQQTSLPPGPKGWSIPAWAGETATGWAARGGEQVYPRVGGGNILRQRFDADGEGLSPRGRGKPLAG